MKRLAVLLLLACTPATAAETLVAFTAAWCGPCQRLKADLADDPQLAGDREIRMVDVDDEPGEARRCHVRTVPTFLLLRDGEEVRRLAGYPGAKKFREWVERK